MFAITVQNEKLIYDENIERPGLAANEVLIEVAYAGVNRADLWQAVGKYPPPEGASEILGLEASGIVAEIGSAVTDFSVGDEVCALLEGGGYAQYARVAASQCFNLPKGWSLREAGALPEALFTVWLALFHTAKIKAGETVLIHGGASGIGSMASQMAAAVGANAITTASTPEKCAFSKSCGATKSYSYKQGDWQEAILNDYKGVDVVLDIVGGEYFQKNLKLLKPYGRMVNLAFLESSKAELNMAHLLFKQLSWHGLTLRGRTTEQKAHLANEIKQNCWDWLENRKVIPAIYEEFSLKDAEKAHKKMQQNLNLGKILLKTGS